MLLRKIEMGLSKIYRKIFKKYPELGERLISKYREKILSLRSYLLRNKGILISKNGKTFKISMGMAISDVNWYVDNFQSNKWEEDTLNVIDYYADTNKVYIDVGAWIGPTVLYAAKSYKRIICFEPDPVANKKLQFNLNINKLNNISLFNKALFSTVGTIKFGGTTSLGDSTSTTLVNDSKFSKNHHLPEQIGSFESRTSNIIYVESITIDQAIEDAKIQPSSIALIKIDIEGGEFYTIPAMSDFLMKYKPPIQLSVHFMYLLPQQIETILKILFNIYAHCYIFEDKRIEITMEKILQEKIPTLVFEDSELL